MSFKRGADMGRSWLVPITGVFEIDLDKVRKTPKLTKTPSGKRLKSFGYKMECIQCFGTQVDFHNFEKRFSRLSVMMNEAVHRAIHLVPIHSLSHGFNSFVYSILNPNLHERSSFLQTLL